MVWASSPEAVGISSERLERIRPAVEKHIGADKIAGAVTLVARRGEIVHFESTGLMDREEARPMRTDTIFRIYSMTKPVICVALMKLYEKGHFQLFEPVANRIPAFAGLKVYAGEGEAAAELVDLASPVTIRQLMTHTSGLTYHWLENGPVEEMYRRAEVSCEASLADFVAKLVELPLAFQPGTAFRYSFAQDVAAYLIEVVSGQALDVFLRENLFDPLGMLDTGYYVPPEKLDRFAAMYGSVEVLKPDVTATQWWDDAEAGVNDLLASPTDCLESRPHRVFRGGHGLVSTAMDYYRFCQMLLNNGELGGARILGRKTIELMTTNHLAREMLPFEIAGEYSPGQGYGLGFGVLMDLGQYQRMGSEGTFNWGGAADTSFWIDPKEELIGIHMAQFQPGGYHLLGDDFRTAVYQAIVD